MAEEIEQQDPILNIRGSRVGLGPFRRDLIPLYLEWVNDFEIMRTYGMPRPVTEEQALAVYEQEIRNSESLRFAIYDLESITPIGYTSLVHIDYRNRRAEFEILIGDRDFHGKGYGAEVTTLMLDYAFSKLGLHSVVLEVASHNEAGIRAYRRAGFREIGRRREAFLMEGQWHDKVYMDILESEFERPVFGKIQSDD
jgi:diamine N-acetyltransferase